MRQNAYCCNLKLTFEDSLPGYCYAIKTKSTTIRQQVSQPGSAGKGSDQNRRQKVVNRGALPSNLTKIPLTYSVSYFRFGGLGALFEGVNPPKSPVATGLDRIWANCTVALSVSGASRSRLCPDGPRVHLSGPVYMPSCIRPEVRLPPDQHVLCCDCCQKM